MMRANPRRRGGFTLVELMIAAAITIMIMTILSYCFQLAMAAMSQMRAQGDAADQIRAFGEVLKRDVNADHHMPVDWDSVPMVRNRGRRTSDYHFESGAPSPQTGFMWIQSPPSLYEGNDSLFDSFNGQGSIWMTCILDGGTEENLYTVSSGPGGQPHSSEAAEVAYFLAPMPFGPPGMPVYNLYRRQRLVAVDQLRATALGGLDPEVVSMSGPSMANTMKTVANGGRPGMPGPLTGSRYGDDIILSYVLSFEIKPTWTGSGVAAPGPRGFGQFLSSGGVLTSDWPYDTLTSFAGNLFDTCTPANRTIRLQGVQIRIRIYDPKVKTARQATFMFDL